ncbi:MAG: S24/S26 family peptidase [Ruminococcus sp.]|uniref:S24/S26 family peptidase n=1 Tax=Ruminococcus sp. TaxID=41978 RepID=UPI002873B454|nr:S24/S26 family peptidase [Ruminococcus sp.]MBQ3284308.1 S24/S26 family peptidase [Ruminococcus sp.]
MAKSTFEQVIAEEGVLVYSNVGDSMYPLIKPRDLLVIKKPELPMKRLDIPLYKRDNGQYVLHRIVGVRGDEYLICGDNRVDVERGITDRHIIGMLTDIIRDGESISVYSFKKRVYAHLWSDFRPIKRVIFRIRREFKKRRQN